MKNVDFKKDGWFSKFYRFSTNLDKYEKPTKNGCKVAWTTLFAVLLLPLTWWNIPFNYLQKDISERPPNLIAKALLGLFFYVIYLMMMGLGFSLFVSGINTDGEVYNYLINLVHLDNINLVWLFLVLPILAILTIGIGLFSIGAIVVLFLKVRESILDYFNHIDDDEYVYDALYENGEDGENNVEIKRSTFTNFMRLLISIKDKYCPVINWK